MDILERGIQSTMEVKESEWSCGKHYCLHILSLLLCFYMWRNRNGFLCKTCPPDNFQDISGSLGPAFRQKINHVSMILVCRIGPIFPNAWTVLEPLNSSTKSKQLLPSLPLQCQTLFLTPSYFYHMTFPSFTSKMSLFWNHTHTLPILAGTE